MIRIKRSLQLLPAIAGIVFIVGLKEAQAQHEHQHHHNQTNNEQHENSEPKLPARTKRPVNRPTSSPENKNSDSENTNKRKMLDEDFSITLNELEQLALANNPTLKKADSAIRAAEGLKIQAGLFPNPVVGFAAEDLSLRNFPGGGKAMFFIEQKIPLGGKLAKSRRVFEKEKNKAEAWKDARRARILNSLRLLYYEALGAQQLLEIKKELAKLAEETVEISAELYNVGLKDQPDQLDSEIEQQRAEAEYFEALNQYEELWQKIGAMVGKPDLQPSRLSGNLADFAAEIDSEELLAGLLKESPEIKAAEIQVERAKSALKRARAEKTPDLYLRGGVGFNNEIIEDLPGRKRAGAEGFIEVGVTLPIFNRNQGGIQTAEAELAIAEREVDRLKLALRTKFAQVLANYRNALFRAGKYRTQIVPKAKIAYEMYSTNFQNMTAAYTNVLSTRAAYLRAQAQYARNLTAVQKSLVLLKGFLLAGGLEINLENDGNLNSDADLETSLSAENPVNEPGEDRE